MTRTIEIILLALLLLFALLAGVAVAYLQERTHRRKRRTRKAAPPTSSETVYSAFDGDAIPIDSDIDPLEEAELYLAYGNKKGALDVLDKAMRSMPDRDDIRLKLETLRTEIR